MSKVYLRGKIHTIQQIRLLHAVAEVGFEIEVDPGEASKFDKLSKRFDLSVEEHGSPDGQAAEELLASFDHKRPMTTLGDASRPLVFPKQILGKLRKSWVPEPQNKISFAGLITTNRYQKLSIWIDSIYGKEAKKKLPNPNRLFERFRARIIKKMGMVDRRQVNIGDVCLWSSNRGRRFPYKAWDEEYYNLLLNSEFVICPSGDFIWTYRFYEAVMCGAIPIVEERCDLYRGYKFLLLDDVKAPNSLQWSMSVAERNLANLSEQMTFSEPEIFRACVPKSH